MPRFKKPQSDTAVVASSHLPEPHYDILRQHRQRFIKELDVASVVEFILSNEGLSHEQRDAILARSTREERAEMLLVQLEVLGQHTFSLFVDALRKYHKQLCVLIDEMLHNFIDQKAIERTAISGTMLRKVLHSVSSANHLSAATLRDSESADESFEETSGSR